MDDFSNNVLETTPSAEQALDLEQVGSLETVESAELVREKENLHPEEEKPGEEKKEELSQEDLEQQSETSGSSAGAAAGAAGAVAAVVAVSVLVSSAISNMNVDIDKLDVYGSSFDYSIVATMEYQGSEDQYIDFSDVDSGLVLVIANREGSDAISLIQDPTDVHSSAEAVLKDEENLIYDVTMHWTGQYTGLKENSRYQVAVIGDEDGKTVTYAQKEFKTIGPQTKFNGVSWMCRCTIDDTFRFTLDYIDENSYYSDFTYELMNKNTEKVVASGSIDDPKKEVVITGSASFPGKDYVLKVAFKSSAESDVKMKNGLVTIDTDVEL